MPVYKLKSMFTGIREGQKEPTFFTRDEEHLLSELPPDVLKEAVDKGWVQAIPLPEDFKASPAARSKTK